jgi:hypothetical protein
VRLYLRVVWDTARRILRRSAGEVAGLAGNGRAAG